MTVNPTTTYSNVTIRINGGPEIPCRQIEFTYQYTNVQHSPNNGVIRQITEAQLAYMLIIAYERCDVVDPDDLEAHEHAFRRMSNAEGSALIELWKALPKQNKAPQFMYDRLHQAQQLKAQPDPNPPPQHWPANNPHIQTTTGTGNAPSAFASAPAAPRPTLNVQQPTPPATPPPSNVQTPATRTNVVLPPVGRYAMQEIDPITKELIWKFYVVTQSRRNTSLRFMQEQYGDNKRSVPYTKLDLVCTIINSNPQFHMEQYGKQIGRCGKCGRTLTDPESIERGIGPECWSRMS